MVATNWCSNIRTILIINTGFVATLNIFTDELQKCKDEKQQEKVGFFVILGQQQHVSKQSRDYNCRFRVFLSIENNLDYSDK